MSADTSVAAEMDADAPDSAVDQPSCHEARVMSGLGFAEVSAPILEAVTLDASSSSSALAGVALSYEWSLVSKPAGSSVTLGATSASSVSITPDVAGDYLVRVEVAGGGLRSCAPARVLVRALDPSVQDIRIELTWNTPADPDQTDQHGTDLELHYMHPNGVAWNRSPWDVFWQNREGDWGVLGDPDDNPSLDIDDTDGAGPEILQHDRPELGKSYAIGVYYYADNGFGPSYATVRIYIRGALVAEERDLFLERTESFALVGRLSWPSGEFVFDGAVTTGFPAR